MNMLTREFPEERPELGLEFLYVEYTEGAPSYFLDDIRQRMVARGWTETKEHNRLNTLVFFKPVINE